MSMEKTLLLGFVAGVTILLGLPIARMRRPAPTLRAMLNSVAVGVLLFLLWDVLSGAWEPIDAALTDSVPRSATARCSRAGWPSDCSRSCGMSGGWTG